jgi:hypothetical protein
LELFADNITVNAQDVQGPALLSNNAGYSGKIDANTLTILGGTPNVGYKTGSTPMQISPAGSVTTGTATADLVTTPTRAFSYLLNEAKAGSGSPTGTIAVSGKTNYTIMGPLWVNGHIQISCNGTLNITGPIYVSDWFEINAKDINLSGVIYAKTWIHFNSWQTITSTGPGVTLVSEGEVEIKGGTGSQEINLTALNGLGILAGDYMHIWAKYFSASGLLYAEDSIEFSVSEKFSLDGVFATKDHFKIATPKQLKLNWVDLSSVLPTEIGGASPTQVISITQQSWREVQP